MINNNTDNNNNSPSNIEIHPDTAYKGLDMDSSISQIAPGKLTYALNASVENFDANGISYQNEQGNELCLSFPNEFILIGKHFIAEKNKHIFFITNPTTQQSEIGYMENNDCIYHTLVSATCLNFNINYPIHKVVHKITNCTTEIYWTDGFNPRRYMDIDSPPWKLSSGSSLCNPIYDVGNLDCNRIKLQPNFNIPELKVTKVISGGNLVAGTVQFAAQYCDASGNGYTSFYSVTNPCPIVDTHITDFNFNYNVGKSVKVNISNLDITGEFRYFNLAVIKSINSSISVNLVGTYSIDSTTKTITYTGEDVTTETLSISDIFEKYPYYEIAQDLTAVSDVLVWDNLTSIDRINYQSIASQISLQWQSYKLPSTESYADEFNATNLKGYLRDEIYAIEIAFLLKNGKQTDSFHIPGRVKNNNENFPDVLSTNADFIGEGSSAPYWKIYNTASVTGQAQGDPIGNATPYEYGEFAYWESEETYPCNENVWGDLAGKPIRHHKFPDILVSPAFESGVPEVSNGKYIVSMQNNSVFPLGIKVDSNQIRTLINSSSLTDSQKEDIVGFKILRGDRGTNKSIIAKGILRNVGEYTRQNQKYYYPNYPYNDLNSDPFINETNNAWIEQATPWIIYCYKDPGGNNGKATYTYTSTETGKPTPSPPMHVGEIIEICSSTRPFANYPDTLYIGPGNYDVFHIQAEGCRGFHALWNDPFTKDNSSSIYNDPWLCGGSAIFGGCSNFAYTRVDVGAGVTVPDCSNGGFGALCPCFYSNSKQTPLKNNINQFNFGPGGSIFNPTVGRRSSLNCGIETPINPFTDTNKPYRQIFNSPETSFGQPFLGDILKLENVMYGAGKAHHVEVKNNAKYRLLSKEAQIDALNSSYGIGVITGSLDGVAMFTAYQIYLQIFTNGILRKNFGYSYNSIASYDYSSNINNNAGIKQRQLDLKQYLIPVVQSVGEPAGIGVNNYQRETSIYLKTKETVDALPLPSNTPSLLNGTIPYITDISRKTISDFSTCNTPEQQKDISVVSYYGSIKNNVTNLWRQIYSYQTIDTGAQQLFDSQNYQASFTAFGGDTFISRFAFKTKLPFFIDNRVNSPDDSEIFYDELGNIGYPKYWHSSRSIFYDYNNNGNGFKNLISIKAHKFDCATDPSTIPSTSTGIAGTYRTYYDGKFYLFAYGIPSFYCESSYNTDLRQAFNNREGDFWPHVTTGIPDDWVQENFVSIAFDNTYHYNPSYSKQNKENYFSHLPADWEDKLCYTNYPFRAIYSDTQEQNADVRVNNWLIYKPLSLFDFPQNNGKLISLDGIENKTILARFENKSLLYNVLLTMDSTNPKAAYLGGTQIFGTTPPVDFAETDLGYVGSQNKFLLKIPQGQITIDAKRGQVFLLNGRQTIDLSQFGSGMNRFFTDHLAFEILRYFPNINTDNNYTGIGLHGVYDSKFDRVIITKLDYIPLDSDIKYDDSLNKFYIPNIVEGLEFRTQVYLTDPEFFCNKSWTLSYGINTKSWNSFHSYLPNFYIGENNFFYSGLNGCCTDFEGSFQALVGDTNKTTTTTSSTTSIPLPPLTTTTTTINRNCFLGGTIIQTNCILNGTAVITIPPTPTTTMCTRPQNLFNNSFGTGYQVGEETPIVSTGSQIDVCNAISFLILQPTGITPTIQTVQYEYLKVGFPVYLGTTSTDCTLIDDGWYFTEEGLYNNFAYHVLNGIIKEIVSCNCDVTTTTTTTAPTITDCCTALVNSGSEIYYHNIGQTMELVNVPDYTSGLGLAMTKNYLWSVDTQFHQWDITLTPFSATFNKTFNFPSGFTTISGITAKDDETIIAVNNTGIMVSEINVETEVLTPKFTIRENRIAIGNLIYTPTNKLLLINKDTITNVYYLTQYDYLTGTIEYDITISTITPTNLYECNCWLFIIDNVGQSWMVQKNAPFDLLLAETFSNLPISITQVSTCTSAEIPVTTTTTTTI